MAIGQFLHLRLFAEGVELPVISAVVQSQKNQAAMASIQIPANDYALEFKPRTLIHLFFYDFYNGAPEDTVRVAGRGISNQPSQTGTDPELAGLFPPERFESNEDQTEEDLRNLNYRLLFGGEVVGIQTMKSPASRSIVLQCVDWSSYWDIALQYQVSGFSPGVGGGIRAAFTNAATTVFNDFLEGSADAVMRLIDTPPRNYRSLRGTLMAGLMHIIEAIGGVYFGQRAIRGVNDFFSLAEMRLHLTQMIGANPFTERDETRLMRAHGFGSLFRRTLSGLGRLVSIRAILLALQRFIFHEIVPITTPRYIPPLVDPNLPNYETVSLEQDPDTRPLSRAASQIRTRCLELKERQQRSTTVAEADRQSNLRGGLATELRRLDAICGRAEVAARRVGLQFQGSQFADFYSIPEISRAFATAGNNLNQVGIRVAAGPGGHAAFQLSGSSVGNTVEQILQTTADLMQQVMESQHRRRVQRTTAQPDPPARLLTQIYRPDVWMVAPPRCNVIFPELYSSFQYTRDFNAEVSRLLLRTHSAFFGSDVLFDGFYMAPSRILGQRRLREMGRGSRGGLRPQEADAPLWFVRDLMDHELYTGIIPSFERMSDLNLQAIRGGSVNIDGVRVGYAQLACNHIFFQYRFKSRQLALSGKFNPFLAFGFPAVVVDKYLPIDRIRNANYDLAVAARIVDSIREGEGEIGPPSAERTRIAEANDARAAQALVDIVEALPNSHYLGTPGALVHSVSAEQGGTTQIQMEYARTTNERTEFLGDNLGMSNRVRRRRNQNIRTVVAALESPSIGAVGWVGGEITNVRDVTDRFTRRTSRRTGGGSHSTTGGTLPLFVGNRRFVGRERRGTRVTVGVSQSAASYGPEVVALVGAGGATTSTAIAGAQDVTVEFRAYELTEQVGVYERRQVDVPPEDLVFPPWYGEHYRSNNIGGLYSFYFGVGAITDATTFVDPTRFTQDGGTIGGEESPASERSQVIRFINRMSEIVSQNLQGVGVEGQPPPPGGNEVPTVSGGQVGPPGEPSDPETEGQLSQVQARSPIDIAIEEVVRAYSLVKLNHFDVHEFIRAYTWRPIANMVDMFGTANLEINDRGEVVRGTEGFHSRAFGDYDDLTTLVSPGDGSRPATILGVRTTDPDSDENNPAPSRDQPVQARLDTRKEKRLAVLRYRYGLLAQRGILG